MNMIEKVARAICIAAGDDPDGNAGRRGNTVGGNYWRAYVTDARGALTAMREPTEEMVNSGAGRSVTSGFKDADAFVADPDVRLNWREMIDAALAEG